MEEDNEVDTVCIDDEEADDFLEGLGRMRRGRKRVRLARKVLGNRKQDSKNMTGKALAEKYTKFVDKKAIRDALAKGHASWLPHAMYSIKFQASAETKMFEPSDTYEAGVTNVNGGQLKTNQAMLVTHIQVLSGVHGSADTEAAGKTVDFGEITALIANGNFTMENGSKKFIDDSSLQCFKSTNTSKDEGIYELAAPKLIQPNTDIVFNMTSGGTPVAHTFLKVVAYGLITAKA